MQVGRLTNAKLVCELQCGIAQEGKTRAQARLKGRLNLGWVDGNDRDSAVCYFGRLMELNQFPQLNLSFGSPRTSVEGEDKRLAFR